MHKNLAKIARVAQEISTRTDRQTDRHMETDILVTILRKKIHVKDIKLELTTAEGPVRSSPNPRKCSRQ